MLEPGLYALGDLVQASDATYLRRSADQDLLDACQKGIFAFVLSPTQMGKSSLFVETARKLRSDGVKTVHIDLNEIGSDVSPTQWYLSVLSEVRFQLDLRTDPEQWWLSQGQLPEGKRFSVFLRTVLLQEVKQSV